MPTLENTELTVRETGAFAGELTAFAASAAGYAAQAKAANTLRAYASDWADFQNWCHAAHCIALPADPRTVALYCAALADAGRKTATISRRLSAISKTHSAAGLGVEHQWNGQPA